MEFSKTDLELESISVEPSDVCLSSSAQMCQVCGIGTVMRVGRHTDLIIYTRSGTVRGVQEEMRCNNRTLYPAGLVISMDMSSQVRVNFWMMISYEVDT